MRKISIKVAALLLVGLGVIWALQSSAQVSGPDPCLTRTNVNKLSVPVASATSATTAVITGQSDGPQIYICGFDIMGGASATWSLEYGTGTSCTGTNALTGTYPAATNVVGRIAVTQMTIPTGNNVCVVETGGTDVGGYITYAIQ